MNEENETFFCTERKWTRERNVLLKRTDAQPCIKSNREQLALSLFKKRANCSVHFLLFGKKDKKVKRANRSFTLFVQSKTLWKSNLLYKKRESLFFFKKWAICFLKRGNCSCFPRNEKTLRANAQPWLFLSSGFLICESGLPPIEHVLILRWIGLFAEFFPLKKSF